MKITMYIEHEIGPEIHRDIGVLRNSCFPEDPKNRSYGKQIPHFRFLSYKADTLVGYLGVDHRIMSFGYKPYSVFGMIDVCVSVEHRHQGIGEGMLTEAESLAKEHNIDCMVLLANDFSLYERVGFTPINSVCQWLRISEHINYGVAVEYIEGELMLKPLSKNFNAEGPIDFLGYMF